MKYLKYIIAFFIIVIPSVVTVLIYNDKITEDSPMYYKKGVEYYNQGNYPVAYSKFLKIKWISPLYPIALYKQAKSAQKIGDYTTATLKYEAFLEKTPDSIFAKTAKFNLGKCYFYLKKYPEAKTAFINSKTNPLDKGAEDYYIGLIEKKTDKVKAAEYFKNYISYETENDKPNEIIAAEELSSLDTIHTIEDYILLGKVYYKNKKYTKAIEYFSKVPIASVWDYLVLANHYAGNKVIARKLMESGMKLYSDKISEENLHSIYDIYVSYMKGTKLKNWNKLLTLVRAASVKGEDYVMYKLATFQSGEKALALYNEIQDKYPNSKFAPESLWNVFWDSYRKGNYTKAEELAYKHIKQYRNVKSTTRYN